MGDNGHCRRQFQGKDRLPFCPKKFRLWMASAKSSSLSSSSKTSVSLVPLEFVLIYFAGRRAGSRDNGLDSSVETAGEQVFSVAQLLKISGFPIPHTEGTSQLPSLLAHHLCLLVLYSMHLEYHFGPNFQRFRIARVQITFAPLWNILVILGLGRLLCAWVDSLGRWLLSVLKYLFSTWKIDTLLIICHTQK